MSGIYSPDDLSAVFPADVVLSERPMNASTSKISSHFWVALMVFAALFLAVAIGFSFALLSRYRVVSVPAVSTNLSIVPSSPSAD
ncbi:MAG: hypothetical protein AAGK78_06295 [Planctomycetota bacterium]